MRLGGHVADIDGVAIPGKEPGITLTVKGADGVEEDVPLEW